jgi:hypothetical protein
MPYMRRQFAASLSLALVTILLARPASAETVKVATASDFVRAVNSGAADIAITDHLDLRDPPQLDSYGTLRGALNATSRLKSILVRSPTSARTPRRFAALGCNPRLVERMSSWSFRAL